MTRNMLTVVFVFSYIVALSTTAALIPTDVRGLLHTAQLSTALPVQASILGPLPTETVAVCMHHWLTQVHSLQAQLKAAVPMHKGCAAPGGCCNPKLGSPTMRTLSMYNHRSTSLPKGGSEQARQLDDPQQRQQLCQQR